MEIINVKDDIIIYKIETSSIPEIKLHNVDARDIEENKNIKMNISNSKKINMMYNNNKEFKNLNDLFKYVSPLMINDSLYPDKMGVYRPMTVIAYDDINTFFIVCLGNNNDKIGYKYSSVEFILKNILKCHSAYIIETGTTSLIIDNNKSVDYDAHKSEMSISFNIINKSTPYKIYIVKENDTLYDIALKTLGSGLKYRQIAELNGMEDFVINVGDRLIIPLE